MTPALHVVTLPHTQTTRTYDWCAYTAKMRRFATFMHDSGWRVVLYAGEHNEARCDELVTVITDDQQAGYFAEDPDWTKGYQSWWNPNAAWWLDVNVRTVAEMATRLRAGDLIMVCAGRCQQLLERAFPDHPVVEMGVGYEGTFARYRVWESYAWRHHVLGIHGDRNGSETDTVIPNSYDPEEYRVGLEPGDYLLFMARVAKRKGVEWAVEVARRLELPLVVAGPCVREHSPGRIVADEVTLEGDGLEYRGVVVGAEKAKLLAEARALLSPTWYIEPFGGVAVEAMMSGTPVVCTDWGAYTETIRDGIDGFRCQDPDSLTFAARAVDTLDRARIAADARARFDTKSAATAYARYLERVGLIGTVEPGEDGGT